MRIAIVFHKSPYGPPTGIDLVRIRTIAGGLIQRGIETEILSPRVSEGSVDGMIPVRDVSVLDAPGRYDLVKTSYHDSILLAERYRGPIVSRIVRVVDERLPERDEPFRQKLLNSQELISHRATALVLNNEENRLRWRRMYGNRLPITLIPTGCPAVLPPITGNPFTPGLPVILFLGSLAAPRMVHMLNEAARRLGGAGQIHLVGLNKACMYGGGDDCEVDPSIVDHGELDEPHIWPYIGNAGIGLALATGPYPFDNDVSKILNYLRAGLPVLSEEPIVNNDLIRQTGFGKIFKHGDIDDLVDKALQLLNDPPENKKESVMRFMADEHSWDKRIESYVELFNKILSEG